MPSPESGARERLGGPASPADQGLQARENQPAEAQDKKKAISLPRKLFK